MLPAGWVDIAVVVCLMFMTVSIVFFVPSAVTILEQARRTLTAYERLANTLDAEVPATLNEFKQLADRVNQLGSVTTQRVTDVGHKVEEVSGSIGQAAEVAKKESSVWGSALWAGVRAYLSAKDSSERGPQTLPESKQITKDRGEQNVR